jgi:hypothetical protein
MQTRVIVKVDHPKGTRLCVIQQFNDFSPELFTTSISFDDGDGNWRWYYFDHEDSYWNSITVCLENRLARLSPIFDNT